jgi:hypothetical protein
VKERELRFVVGERGEVSALCIEPGDAASLLVLAHGAGAGMRHPFMEGVAQRLAERRVATFRYEFPYMAAGRRAPDRPAVLTACVRAAVAAAAEVAPALPRFAGGKSLGGRMTSTAQAEAPLPGVCGLVFLGFPLHAPGTPSARRGEHLQAVALPMLFLQGTRDKLADLSRMESLCQTLGPRATLHVVDGGDHSFHVPKRSGRDDDDAQDEIADAIAGFTRRRG